MSDLAETALTCIGLFLIYGLANLISCIRAAQPSKEESEDAEGN